VLQDEVSATPIARPTNAKCGVNR